MRAAYTCAEGRERAAWCGVCGADSITAFQRTSWQSPQWSRQKRRRELHSSPCRSTSPQTPGARGPPCRRPAEAVSSEGVCAVRVKPTASCTLAALFRFISRSPQQTSPSQVLTLSVLTSPAIAFAERCFTGIGSRPRSSLAAPPPRHTGAPAPRQPRPHPVLTRPHPAQTREPPQPGTRLAAAARVHVTSFLAK